MVVIRRRLIFWLIKAYIKKSGKTMVLSFLLGLVIFFALLFGSQYFAKIIPIYKKESVGLIGAYTQENLPLPVVNKLSRGLTKVEADGSINPDLASSWQEMDSGKTYVFHLKPDVKFNDGKPVTSDEINYNFSDVSIERPDKQTIIFKLKDQYAPFLITVSRPIFKKGFVGISDYRIENIKLNGNFVQTLTIASPKSRIRYQFYPSEEALRTAFLLGEINEIDGLTSQNFKNTTFEAFPNTNVAKEISSSRLVTLFYNTTDSTLSDKKIRVALSYAMPDGYPYGEKAYLPYALNSIYYNNDVERKTQDYAHAKVLLEASSAASESAATLPQLQIKTLSRYRPAAELIAASWKQAGITATIEEVDRIPSDFQIFLGDFNIPKDPDQYTLWHSDQANNITKYKNLRIDKLLEDGRKTVDIKERKRIYGDFQKYLMEDAPASFLYFPYEYSVVRK